MSPASRTDQTSWERHHDNTAWKGLRLSGRVPEAPAGQQVSRDLSQMLRVGSLRFSVTAARRVMVWKRRVLVAVHKVSDVWASPGLERALQRERGETAQLCASGGDLGP